MKKKLITFYDVAKQAAQNSTEKFVVFTVIGILLWVLLFDWFTESFPKLESFLASGALVAFLLLISVLITGYFRSKRDQLGQ